MGTFDQMDNEIAESRKIFQEQLHKLESGNPNRYLDVILLTSSVKHQLSMAQAMGMIDDVIDTPAAIKVFLKALSHDNDPKIRSDVAKELGNISYDIAHCNINLFRDIPGTIEQGLISALTDESTRVQKAATKALRKIGTPSALAAIPSKPWWKFW